MKLLQVKTAGILFLLLLLATIGGTAVSAQDVTTLRMTGQAGIVATALQTVLPIWNERNPDIQVELDVQADEVNWQATAPTTMFADPNGPDLSWWRCSPLFQYNDMIEADLLVPLDGLYESEGWYDAFPQGTLDFYTEPNGSIYGVNIDVVWTPYIYYNKELFAEVGAEVPTTWEGLYEVADKVRAGGYQPMVNLYDWGLVNHLPDALMMRSWSEDEYRAFMLNANPGSPDWANEYKWTDPHGLRIFATMKEMVDRGLLADGFAGHTEYSQGQGLFTGGSAAMWQMGSWASGSLSDEVDFEWGYFYYPPFDDGMIEPYGPVGSWIPNCFIVFNRENQEAALKVVTYLASAEGIETYSRASGLAPGRIDIPQEAVAEILTPEAAQQVADVGMMGAPSLYEANVPPDVLSALKQASDLVLNGVVTPEEAAEMVQEATEEARKG
ncbi:MAG: extracellular solute-binding protein [Chloroflexi bacterium]|nr:extracellular solute-binding protein [Chloroflexota bacterium]